MPQMFFGQFLIDEQVISDAALHQAIELATEENSRIGALGVERGYLSEAQVEVIQLEQRRTDMPFADLAVQLEMLTRDQSVALLQEQKRRHKPIGEALVQLGFLDTAELDDLLDRYHLCQLDLDAAHIGLPFELCDEDLFPYLVEYFPVLFRRITQIPMKLQAGRNFPGRSNLPFRVSVTIEGDCPVTIGIAACPELAARLATGLGGSSGPDLDREAVGEYVREFAEILCDAGCRSVRRDGLSARASQGECGQLPKQGFWFPATTPFGRGILVLDPAED
ncbi:MAG: hypothetical protein IH881_10140 [Myxococcales bacterium]|nr:hypothetical protein [Myxococcales bacterium]